MRIAPFEVFRGETTDACGALMRAIGDALVGLSVVPIVLAVASLRNHSGWALEFSGGKRSLKGIRARGDAMLLGAVMIALGNALAADSRVALQWMLFVGTLGLSLGFATSAPEYEIERESGVRSAHQAIQPKLTTASKRLLSGLFLGALICATMAALT